MNPDHARIRHLFLDLEDTVITPVVEGWGNVGLINIPKIRAMIRAFEPQFVSIFSFAIHNDFDKRQFDAWTRARIEQALDIKLSFVPTVDAEIIPTVSKSMRIAHEYVSLMDMNTWWGKQFAFREFTRQRFKGPTPVTVLLLDDMVYNENFEFIDNSVKGRIINIDQLKYDENRSILGTGER